MGLDKLCAVGFSIFNDARIKEKILATTTITATRQYTAKLYHTIDLWAAWFQGRHSTVSMLVSRLLLR